MNDTQDELAAEGAPRKPSKGIYVLPNLFTLAALFGGFYAIVMAMNERFDLAAIGVFCAMADEAKPKVAAAASMAFRKGRLVMCEAPGKGEGIDDRVKQYRCRGRDDPNPVHIPHCAQFQGLPFRVGTKPPQVGARSLPCRPKRNAPMGAQDGPKVFLM